MNLNQQRLDSLHAQLQMAQSRHPVSKMQVALLKAQIKALEADIKPVEPEEVYSVHTMILEEK
jgi:hypothetical protein